MGQRQRSATLYVFGVSTFAVTVVTRTETPLISAVSSSNLGQLRASFDALHDGTVGKAQALEEKLILDTEEGVKTPKGIDVQHLDPLADDPQVLLVTKASGSRCRTSMPFGVFTPSS